MSLVPYGHLGEPEDIARAASWTNRTTWWAPLCLWTAE